MQQLLDVTYARALAIMQSRRETVELIAEELLSTT